MRITTNNNKPRPRTGAGRIRGNLKTPWCRGLVIGWCVFGGLNAPHAVSAPLAEGVTSNARVFLVKGIVRGFDREARTVTISHEAVADFMKAMTMPFEVRDTRELQGLQPGDDVTFRLHVTPRDSWVDRITLIGQVKLSKNRPPTEPRPIHGTNSVLDYEFTNELGRLVSLNSFRGQALAVTFIYTRCPLPNYCPRLSANFQEASQKLLALPDAPTNWHFLSISFDPDFDSPAVLKAYGRRYKYDPKHWSFLTGARDKIAELARLSGVHYQSEYGLINHNFRTLIVDANGHLQTVFPVSGDYSDSIVAEIIKAATVPKGQATVRESPVIHRQQL